MDTPVIPFGLSFMEPIDTDLLTQEAGWVTLCREAQAVRFDGRPLCELTATEMVESKPTEKDGKDPINVDSDPFYD